MTHTLVTFLGRTQRMAGGGYRHANYRFPDGTKRRSVYFGVALADHLSVDRVVMLGTKGSMWSVLVENLAAEGLAGDDAGHDRQAGDVRLALYEAEEKADVSQSLLDRMTPMMSAAAGRPVSPRLIPSGRDETGQYVILEEVAAAVPGGAVSFDLTHGFRHLGMVGFMSAFMLERVRELSVRGLWYGALDMTDPRTGVSPVLRLDGLTRARRWMDALDRFDSNGDYGVFAPLLVEDGVAEDKARCLEKAAFFERTLNLSDAAQQLRIFLPVLDAPLSGASGLFIRRLKERLAWARDVNLAGHQRKLALQHLDRGDYTRAAVFGWEALVTQECDRRGFTASDYRAGRRPAIDEFEAEIKGRERDDGERLAFYRLKTIRNALAHGNPPNNSRYRAMLKDPGRLGAELREALRSLLYDGGGG